MYDSYYIEAYGNYSFNDNYSLYDDNYTFDDSDYEEEAGGRLTVTSILPIVIYAVTFLLGAPGNAAVIWIAGFKMKRTVNSVWFVNLAVADLAYCCSLPFQIANVALGNGWPSDNLLCKLLPSAIVLNMSASVFLLTAVSVDRCLAVTRPIWSQRRRTVTWAGVACGGAWFLALLMCLPTLLTRRVVTYPELGLVFCSVDYQETFFRERTKAVVEVTRALLTFALPFLVMAACYFMIALKVRGAKFAKSSKPVQVIVAVVAAFFVCWLPYHVFGLMQAFAPHPLAVIWDNAAVGLASLNSALNPILYVFVGRDFRQRFRHSMTTALRNAFSEDLTQSVSITRLRSRSSFGEKLPEASV